MIIAEDTLITVEIAKAINALSKADKQTVVDRLTIQQAQDLFILCLYCTL